jgi:CubicO group peptidase (beta-lactamase class C family)
MKTRCVAMASMLLAGLLCCSSVPPGPSLESLSGDSIVIAEMEAEIADLMDMADVPGLSVAILNDSQVVYSHAFGVKNSKTGEPLDTSTVFAGASLSKTVFAYLVMQLVAEGVLDLDRPLHEYLAQPLPGYPRYADLEGDERYRLITPRMCLSHTTGFPNWRWFMDDNRLQFISDPGERHGYSGEGIGLLQMLIEELTDKGIEELARERIFEPLGMDRTGYVWQDGWSDNLARPHDQFSRPKRFNRRHEADAAGSIATTPGDYARLLVAVLNARGEEQATVDQMLTLQIANRHAAMFGPRYWEESDEFDNAGWGLGWGRFDCGELGRAIFHTGHDDGAQNYTVTFVDRGIGVVLMSNSDNFEGVSRQLLEATIGDTCSPVDWMGYPHFDPNEKRDPPPQDPPAIEVERALLMRFIGRYLLSADQELRVELHESGLAYSTDTIEWIPLLAEDPGRFFVESEDERFVFVTDGTGNVIRLDVLQGDQVIPLERIRE